MIKKIAVFYGVVALFVAVVLILAATTTRAESGKKGYSLPANAIQISDNLYSLGTAKDPKTGKEVQGYAFVHRNEPVKPGNHASSRGTACYGFLAKGAKWKGAPESWVMNTANNSGLSDAFLLNAQTADIATWETAAIADVLGNGSTTTANLSLGANTLNNANEVYFDAISNANTIAVTVIWGIFGGPMNQRQLVEWDQIYNTAYQWSSSGEAGKMDFENISTHELGHSFGLDDLYNSACAQQTMYGYAGYGETYKRTLESGDIAGINVLY